MDVVKNPLASNAGFAVHRSFAPTRIERELLARIIHKLSRADEMVVRGCCLGARR